MKKTTNYAQHKALLTKLRHCYHLLYGNPRADAYFSEFLTRETARLAVNGQVASYTAAVQAQITSVQHALTIKGIVDPDIDY